MSKQGSTGWLLLLAVLLVPGFMFYRWRSRLNNMESSAVSQVVRNRLPPGGPFGAPPVSPQLLNPLSSAQAPAATANAMPAGAAPAASSGPVAASAQVSPPAATPPKTAGHYDVLGMLQSQVEPDAPPVAPVAADKNLQNIPVTSTGTIARDPTISPFDLERQRRAAEASEVHPVARKSKTKRKPVHRGPPIETLVDLQGIVGYAGKGNQAIVNGDLVAEGDSVIVENDKMKETIKVLRITSRSVTFYYRGKKFTKDVQ